MLTSPRRTRLSELTHQWVYHMCFHSSVNFQSARKEQRNKTKEKELKKTNYDKRMRGVSFYNNTSARLL